MTSQPPSGARPEGPPAPLQSVQAELAETERYILDVVTSDFPFVTVLAQHLVRAGGKRLRVALPFFGAAFGDGDASRRENVKKLGAAIELTHLATLHHDDILDEADTRHGVPSVNANWSNTLAVLSGDYLFAKSSELAAEIGGPVPLVLAKTIAALCEGQIKEIEFAYKQRSLDDYLYVIERKTARLFAAAASLGAIVGGAGEETADALGRYSIAFGIAFQMADDLLDFLGDEAKTGKPVGTDVRCGVYTLPLLHAMESRNDVRDLLGPDVDVSGVVRILHETGSFGYAKTVAERYAREALDALSGLPAIPERAALTELVSFVVERIPVTPAA